MNLELMNLTRYGAEIKTDFLILGYYEHDQEYLITSEKMIPLNNEKPLNFNSLTARINSLYESMK